MQCPSVILPLIYMAIGSKWPARIAGFGPNTNHREVISMKSISCIQRTSQWENHWVRRFFGGLPVTVILLGLQLSCNSAFAAVANIGQLSSLAVENLSPAFDPAVTQYTIPKTSSCTTYDRGI